MQSYKDSVEYVYYSCFNVQKVGLFDPLENQPYVNLDIDDMNTTYAQEVAYEAALQSFVLLQNKNDTLPLTTGKNIAVVGPFAIDASLYKSDYSDAGIPPDMPSIADAITEANQGGMVSSSQGVSETGNNASGIAAAVEMVKGADITILCLGISKTTEREGIDRSDTLLPGIQESFAHQVQKLVEMLPTCDANNVLGYCCSKRTCSAGDRQWRDFER